MDRLTERYKNYVRVSGLHSMYCIEKDGEMPIMARAIARLADYEDTGLTPEEVGLMISQLKMGDEAFVLKSYRGTKHIKRGMVSDMFYTRDMELIYVVKNMGRGTLGKEVFRTYEEAEAALKGGAK